MKNRRLAVAAIPTRRRVAEAADRATAPVISRLRRGMHVPKQAELERLFHKLPQLDDHSRAEILPHTLDIGGCLPGSESTAGALRLAF